MIDSGFTKVENEINRRRDIDAYKFRVYCVLKSFNPSYPGYKDIQKITGFAPGTISKSIKWLKEKNVIKVKKGIRNKLNNQYEFIDSQYWKIDKNSFSLEMNNPTSSREDNPLQEMNTNKTKDNNTNNNKFFIEEFLKWNRIKLGY